MSWLESLSDPVRLRIVRYLARRGSASLPELAEAAEVHRNTVRPHVTELEEAGLVVRAHSTSSGPGRPVVRYALSEGWTLPTADFRGLAELLVAALARARLDDQQLRRVGVDWGRWLAGRPGAVDAGNELPRALERLGFSAELEDGRVHLSGCPCPLVSPGRPELVCALAAAVADGVLEGAGGDIRVTAREHSPDSRACALSLGPA